MIKLIACDLDGTLLNKDHELSDKTKQAISAIEKANIAFMPATGRAFDAVKGLFEGFETTHGFLLLNGALLVNQNGEIAEEVALDITTAKKCVAILEKHDICYHFYTRIGKVSCDVERSKSVFVEHMRKNGVSDEGIKNFMSSNFCQFERAASDAYEFLAEHPVIYKMEAFDTNHERLGIVKEELRKISNVAITNSIEDNLEITHMSAQKGTTLESFCKKKGIKKEEVLVFGDSLNDLNMIQTFPHSVAMKNGSDCVTQAATYTSLKTNEEDGVAEILMELLKIQL